MTYSRHLNLTDFEVGASCSIAPSGAKLKTGYPRVSRGSFLSGYGSFLCYYAHFYIFFFLLSEYCTAAFTSRSIRFPHSHRYVRSDNASSFFLCPHTLHILLDAKYLSTFIRYFHVLPAISKHGNELTVSVILYPFSKAWPQAIPLQVQILHTYCVIVFCKAVAELMLEIPSSGSLSFHDIKQPFSSVSDSYGCPFSHLESFLCSRASFFSAFR